MKPARCGHRCDLHHGPRRSLCDGLRCAALARCALGLGLTLFGASFAHAHSASDAYLTLSSKPAVRTTPATPTPPGTPTTPSTRLHARWDVALRDLDFVLKLDTNGDGRITWGELRRRQADVRRYVLAGLRIVNAGRACRVQSAAGADRVANHADGAYAVLELNIDCDAPVGRIKLDYTLFFNIDPSHRAILVSRSGGNVATALLAPEHASVELMLGPGPAPAGLKH